MKTAGDFKKAVQENNIDHWDSHDCSICGYMCGYKFEDGEAYYDSGCDCVNYGPVVRPITWESLADHYNMQSHPDVIKEMNEFWKF